MVSLEEVKQENINWFSPENKRFFGDISYIVFNDKEGNAFLIRCTYMWSDMFGEPKKEVYRINKINQDLSIGDLYDNIFNTLEEAKNFLKD